MISVTILLPDHWSDRPLYCLNYAHNIGGHLIPAGFTSDGATIPPILWSLFPTVCRYLPAALVHDYLLQKTSRDYADAEMLRVMDELGIVPWRKKVLYTGIRLRTFWLRYFK